MSGRKTELDEGRKDPILCSAKNNPGTEASVSVQLRGCDVTKTQNQKKNKVNQCWTSGNVGVAIFVLFKIPISAAFLSENVYNSFFLFVK